MPSGLTHGVYEGKDDLRTYLWRIASQFFHHGEIDPVNKLRQEMTESFEHRSLEEAKVELQKLRETSDKDYAKQRAERRRECYKDSEESKRQKAQVRAHYEAMRAQVEAWELPSSLHEGVKALALKQLEESEKWDCTVYEDPGLAAEKEASPKALRAEAIKRAEERLDRQKEYLADHLRRTQERIDFLVGLEKSIGPRPKENS
jgi:hypothetical protein